MERHLSSLLPGSSFLTVGVVAESLQQSVGFEVVSAAVSESEVRRTAVRNGAALRGTLDALDPMASAMRGYQLVARVAAKSGAPSNRLDVARCLDFDAVRDGSFSCTVDDGGQQEESGMERMQRILAREPLPQRLDRRLGEARFDLDLGITSHTTSVGGSDTGARAVSGRSAVRADAAASPHAVPPLALANSATSGSERGSRFRSRRPLPPGRQRGSAVKQTKFGPVLACSIRSRRRTRRVPRPAILGGGASRPYSGDAMREMARMGPATHKRQPLTERRGGPGGSGASAGPNDNDADDEGGSGEGELGPDLGDATARSQSAAGAGGGSLTNPRVAAPGTVLSLRTLAGAGPAPRRGGGEENSADAGPVRPNRGRSAHEESLSAVQGLFATASAFRTAQVQGVNELNSTLDAAAHARADTCRRKHLVRPRSSCPPSL